MLQEQTIQSQSQGGHHTIKHSQIEVTLKNELIQQDEPQYPKVPQTRLPENLYCVECNQGVISNVKYEMGRCSYIVMIILIFGLITAIFSFLPCVLDNCKDVKHQCPKCSKLIGTKQFICS